MDEKEMTMREALNLALDQALAADDRVFLLGEDIADPGASGPTAGLSTKYGHDRVLDTPISEAAIVGAAIGAAIDGLLPVAEIMIMDFIGIAADQLINNAAKLRFMTAGRTTAPITVRTQVYGGLATGATHSQSLEAWFMHIPGMKVIVPSTPRDGKGLLTSAIFDEDPCLFIETIRLQGQKGLVPTDPGFSIPLGQADVKRPGTDVTLISYGRSVHECAGGRRRRCSEQGVSAEVVDLRTLVPLDVETIVESVRRTRRAVVVHDAVRFAGPGAEIAAILQSECFGELEAPVERVGARFVPTPAAAALEAAVYPSPARIVAAAQRTLDKARRARWLTSSFASRVSRSRYPRPNSTELLVEEGQHVEEGAPIFSIATEKVEQEVEAGASGTVQWTGEVGTTYDIGAEIGVIKSSTSTERRTYGSQRDPRADHLRKERAPSRRSR